MPLRDKREVGEQRSSRLRLRDIKGLATKPEVEPSLALLESPIFSPQWCSKAWIPTSELHLPDGPTVRNHPGSEPPLYPMSLPQGLLLTTEAN